MYKTAVWKLVSAALQSYFILTAALLLLSQAGAAKDTDKTIYFLAAGPLPDDRPGFAPSWEGGLALIRAAQIARDHINNRSDILPGYRLELIEEDSGCNIKSKYLIAFVKNFLTGSKKIAGIIGPGCSDTARLLAPVIAKDRVSVIQISPSATSPELVNNTRYSTTLRIPSSALIYADEFIQIIERNGWKKVSVLYEGSRDFFKITFQKFMEKMPEHVNVPFQSAVYSGFYPIEEIRSQQTRVVFAFVSTGTARELICLAYHLDLIYPTFQWIFHDRSTGGFIKNVIVKHNSATYNCSENNMRIALNGAILNNYIFIATDRDHISVPVNVSYNEYESQFDTTLTGGKWAPNAYDATWALALALNESLPELEKRNLSLEDYTFGHKEITDIVLSKLLNNSKINFKGVSESRVKFEKTQDTLSVITITAVQCNITSCKELSLGVFNESELNISNPMGAFINDTFDASAITVHVALGSLILLVAFIILTCTILLHLTNIVYYNFKPIKATSPNLSHLIFSGCYLLLVSVVLFVIKDTFNFSALAYGILCNLYTLCTSLGFSLVFGTICAKIWRVYRIFRHFRTERAGGAISDNALILFVMLLLFLDMTLATTWILFDPWLRISTGTFVGTEIVVQSTCTCKYLIIWVVVIAAYKGMLILTLLLFAILNRNIQRKEFKHTKKVSMFIYTEVLLAGTTLPLFQILSSIQFTASLTVMVVFLLSTVCGCLAFVFLPSVIPLIKVKYRGQPVNIYNTRFSTVSLLTQ